MTEPLMSDPALLDAMNDADAGNFDALEAFYQRIGRDDRARGNTCMFARFDRASKTITEYHRDQGRMFSWWRTVRPAFTDNQEQIQWQSH